MENTLKRRDFLKYSGCLLLSSMGMVGNINIARASSAKIVIVGGGFAGATCAHYLKKLDPSLSIVLIEPKSNYITCPYSNTVLANIKKMSHITHDYSLLKKFGIQVIHDTITDANLDKRTVQLASGDSLTYDKMVISPGISFRWKEIEGIDQSTTEKIPHAWQAGEQTKILNNQIGDMREGGTVIISTPREPYRAPPAPFERASLIAYRLKKSNPSAKVLVITSGTDHSEKLPLFKNAWKKHYGDIIEIIEGDDQGALAKVDVKGKAVSLKDGTVIKGDVLNVIPGQQAGLIAHKLNLVNESGWCPINIESFQSQKFKNVHIIGDACIAGDMPKTAHSANSQAKACAVAIISELNNLVMPETVYSSSIYSLITPKYAISSSALYRIKNKQLVKVSEGLSPIKASKKYRYKEARFYEGWYKSIVADMKMS